MSQNTTTDINPEIFRAYDIRGIADPPDKKTLPDLSEKSVYDIGKATATYLIRKYRAKNMAVGRDNRLTGEKLKKAFIKGVTETGMDVTDVGLATSPMMYFSSCEMGFDSATNITASHNPKQYNGIKTVSKNAHPICGNELQEILKIIQNKKYIKTAKRGKINKKNIWSKYLKTLISKVKIAKRLKVVVDAGNGTAGKFAPEFLKKIGCEVIPIYCDLDGTFPNHPANPEEEQNMKDLISKVKETKANIGIGFDGDGDRIGVVDELGHHYSADFVLFLLTKDILKRIPRAQIVFDVKVSQAIIKRIQELGARGIMSKTGHSFIEEKMKKLSAPLGGEVSGHMFFGENYYGFDDALLAAGKILEILAQSPLPLSKMFDELEKTYATPEFKAPCPDNKKFAIVKNLVKYFTKIYDCVTIDGVRINFDKNSWGAVRASNTSPNLTLRFESNSQTRLKEIQNLMADQLKKYPEVDMSWHKKS